MDSENIQSQLGANDFRLSCGKLRDRMKVGELVVYEKKGDEEVNVTPLAITKIKELIADIQQTLMDE